MSRTTVNFLLDTLLLVAFSILVWSAVIVRFVFPPAYDSRGWTLWDLSLDDWLNVQFAMVAVLALGVLIHVMLHWSWVCGVVASRLAHSKKGKIDNGTQTLYGVGLLIVILNVLGLAIAAGALMIRGPA
ncbi:MAG: DUF4405 domain-containing protein [Pirellulaceae bacterium]|jgi:hypothetical protein|nr:DUF4405 domain-containing protein [Pirellulaceae bacterium]